MLLLVIVVILVICLLAAFVKSALPDFAAPVHGVVRWRFQRDYRVLFAAHRK